MAALLCAVPPWAAPPAEVPIEVSLNGQPEGFEGGRPEPLLFSFYRQPAVSLVTPRGGPSAGGTVLSLFGSGFGALGFAHSIFKIKWS